MYSYEDRVRAVRLYIKLGKRVAATIRQLGYPTKNALKSWHQEHEQRLDLHTGYARAPKYSQAQKELAVEHYLEHGRCVSATIKALGYPSRTLLSAWVQEQHPEARVRLTDITEFQIPAGKVYLSPMIDCFDGMVVSWSIGTRPDAELVNTMLDAAIETVTASSDRPVVHSDRGGHYRWPGWLSRIAQAKLIRSMSRKACSPDNAACEGFFGRLKNELFYSRDWLNTTIDDFVSTLGSYIRWYNEARIKISLGPRSPIDYRRHMGIAA